MGKITINELSPSLIQYIKDLIIQNSGGTTGNPVTYLKHSIELTSSTTSITIPTNFNFNKSTDLLMLFKNSTYLEESYDYTISSDNTTINMVTGSEWYITDEDAPSCLFNLIVLKNVAKG